MDLKGFLYDGIVNEPVLTGSLLLAEPIMDDSYFSRSVVLIVDEPEGGGHVGLMLNKPIDYTFDNLFPDSGIGNNIRIYCGGPVELERLTLLHTLGDELGKSFEVMPGLYVGGEIPKVVDYITSGADTEGKLRFMLGYCGWSPGQLSNEIERHSWVVNNNRNSTGLLTGEGIKYWRREIKELGEDFRGWLMVPPDPSFN